MIVKNIKVLCAMHETTIAEVERKVGISNGTIRHWDKGRPRVDNLKKVADYFHITIDELINDAESQILAKRL